MRNIFLALVLANLGFAAWHAWFAASEAPPRRVPGPGAGITLVKELESGAGETAASSPAAAAGALEETAGSAAAGATGDGLAAVTGDGSAAVRGDSSAAVTGDGSAAVDGSEPGAGAGGGNDAETDSPSEAPSREGRAGETSRVAAAGAEAGIAPAAQGDGSAAAGRCVTVGPFPELAQARSASDKLRGAGYEPSRHAGEGDVWVGYWVYLDAIPSREETNRILSVLRENGISDAYMIPGEIDGDLISLGVFSEVARAGRLRDRIRALGFEPVVEDRTRRENVYWLDVTLGSEQQLDFQALQTPGRITRLEQRPCETTPD
jgi:cell division septation protein DedD